MAKRIMTKGFDTSSSPMHRILRHYIRSRFVPMGFYHGGAGLKCLLILSVTHYLGRPIFWFITRFESQVRRIYILRTKISFK